MSAAFAKVLVTVLGTALIAWVNWYFFLAAPRTTSTGPLSPPHGPGHMKGRL